MKKLTFLFAMIFAVSMAMAQTDLDLDQSAASNTADIWQSDAGPSNVGGTTYTMIDQIAGASNGVEVKQLGRKSDIELTQGAGTTNSALIYQRGNYDNHFTVNQSAGGSNEVDIQLGQAGGGDIHGNDYFVDQTATGNNEVTIWARGNHLYKNSVDLDQDATNGNNIAEIDMDRDWGRSVKIKIDQTSEDNQVYGLVRGDQPGVKVNIIQDGATTNYADFTVQNQTTFGKAVDVYLEVDQLSTFGGNELYSIQESNSSATVFQTSTLGNNYANVYQVNP